MSIWKYYEFSTKVVNRRKFEYLIGTMYKLLFTL